MTFPVHRPRRLRRTETLRGLVRETRLLPGDFMLPLFAVSGRGVRKPIASMPGVAQLSVDNLVEEARTAWNAGVRSLILFGIRDDRVWYHHDKVLPTNLRRSLNGDRLRLSCARQRHVAKVSQPPSSKYIFASNPSA